MDRISKEANLDYEAFNELLFADDQVIIYNYKSQLQEHIDQLNASCEKYDMKISISKTGVMIASRNPDKLDINICRTPLKQVREFKYLGSIFTEDGKLDRKLKPDARKLTQSPTSLPHSLNTPTSALVQRQNSSTPSSYPLSPISARHGP